MDDLNRELPVSSLWMIVLAPIYMLALGVLLPVLMIAIPLTGIPVGAMAIWKGVRYLNCRDDPRTAKRPPDPP